MSELRRELLAKGKVLQAQAIEKSKVMLGDMKLVRPQEVDMELLDPHPMAWQFNTELPPNGLADFQIGNMGAAFNLWANDGDVGDPPAFIYLPGTQAFKDVMAEYLRRGGDEYYFSDQWPN